MSHLLTMSELSEQEISEILKDAEDFANGKETKNDRANICCESCSLRILRGRDLALKLLEKRLGLEVLDFSADASSVQKGETLYDTIRTLESIGTKAVVIRHEQDRYFDELNRSGEYPNLERWRWMWKSSNAMSTRSSNN